VIELVVCAVVFTLHLEREVFDVQALLDRRSEFVDDLLRAMNRHLAVNHGVRRCRVATTPKRTDVDVVCDVDIGVLAQQRFHIPGGRARR
jgi:hypothetical protein